MNLTVSNEITGQIYGPIELSDDMALSDLTALLELECNFDSSKHDLYHNMDILDIKTNGDKAIKELGLTDDDLLLIRNKISSTTTPTSGGGNGVPGTTEELTDDQWIEQFRQELQRNQFLRQQLTNYIPGLQDTIDDPVRFKERFGPFILQRRHAMLRGTSNPTLFQQQNPWGIPQAEYEQLMADPENPRNKKRIDELTAQQAIDEQLRNAYEYTPEVFTTVPMLYIKLEINGYPVKAFVDSGAQMTIMSTRLAEKTGLSRLIDKRFVGEARGVGVGKILGRIHQAQLKIETQFIPGTFIVLDTQVDLLIGLDMLRRHQACIDLKRNVLRIAEVETPFLGEAEIPKEFEDMNSGIQIQQDDGKRSSGINASRAAAEAAVSRMSKPNTGKTGPASSSSVSTPPEKKFSESSIKKLMGLGFSKTEAIRALEATGGNEEYAASLLFQ